MLKQSKTACTCTSNYTHKVSYISYFLVIKVSYKRILRNSCNHSSHVASDATLRPIRLQIQRKQELLVRLTNRDPHLSWDNIRLRLCVYVRVSVAKLLLCAFSHITMTIYISGPQDPHRKELKSSITDDIIKLLNESVAPVEEGLFGEMGLYNKIVLWANEHARGCMLWSGLTALFPSCFPLKILLCLTL